MKKLKTIMDELGIELSRFKDTLISLHELCTILEINPEDLKEILMAGKISQDYYKDPQTHDYYVNTLDILDFLMCDSEDETFNEDLSKKICQRVLN